MISESFAQKYAIQFRRLYLETISSGVPDFKTTWRLARYVNLALWSSREIVASMVIITAVFLIAMPLGSHTLPIPERLTYFGLSILSTFLGIYVLLLPVHFVRIKNWVNSKVSISVAAILSILFTAACLCFFRTLLNVPLDFTYTEVALRVSPMVIAAFGAGLAMSPYTSKRLMRRRQRTNLTNLIDKRKRGQLIMISVQDNYVAVTTSAGTDLLRISLASAMKQIEPGIGLQIHRSHWVAISAIKKVDEQARTVELITGEKLPISTQKVSELTLELSRKDLYSQQSRLFARDIAEVDLLTKILKKNEEARNLVDKMFLEVFQGKPVDDRHRLKIAYQIFRLSSTESTYVGAQLALFTGLAFLGVYGLYELPWYQPPLFWILGYFLCSFITTIAHVFVWFVDLKYGSKGWLGAMLLTVTEGTLSVTVLYFLSYFLFGPVMVPYVVFLVSSYILHIMYAPFIHFSVREHQSYSSWKKALNIPPIVLQLPYETRGEVVAIAADKRTVSVTTTSGTSVIKKKFSEALTLLGERKGIQVHRSHWVATRYIKGRRIDGALNYVELTNGDLIPLAAVNIEKVDNYLRHRR